jgi:hypothetical protein
LKDLCLFIGLSAVIVVLALFTIKDAVAACTPDMLEDWPDTTCGPIQLPPEKQRDYWQGYYKFKGKNWMEEKRDEMEKAILSGNLEQWRSSMSNYNVWLYYKITNNIPEVPPLKQFKSGVPLDQIQCKQGMMLVKKHDNGPACIKASSLNELNFRRVADCVWNCSIPIPVNHIHENETNTTMVIDGKSFYYYTINETLNSAQGEGKKISFHDVTFTLFPRPKIMNLGGFCGSGTFGTSILFSDGVREKLSINIPETECVDKFAKADLTKITNHTNPQAGLTFYDGKMRLLIKAQNQSNE